MTLEVVQRLIADHEAIAACFGFTGAFPRLVALQCGQGDTHDGGRSVAIATFSDDLKLVYKPRRLAVDCCFQTLLAWLNARGECLPFRLLRIVDRGTHGWMEYAAPQACRSRKELERFYQRLGAFLALMYGLAATDYHHENLIAAGEHPVLIDLETLFNPQMANPQGPASGSSSIARASRRQSVSSLSPTSSADSDASTDEPLAARRTPSRETEGTVLDSGLLPQRVWTKQVSGGVDISGIGATDGQVVKVGQLQASGTDEMHWRLTQVHYATNHQHRPTLVGQDVSPWDMRGHILSGFRTLYGVLRRHREALLAPDGPLAGFAEVEIRVILRPTSLYANLLHAGLHPHLLQDALARDRTFDKLWLQAQHVAALRRVIPAEIQALHQGDVPRFVTHPNATDVYAGDGDRVEQFFGTSGMDVVRKRMAGLCDRDLERQSYLAQAALDSLIPPAARTPPAPVALPPAASPATADELLDMATRVGSRLADLAIWQRGYLSWFQLDAMAEQVWSLQPADTSLFKGLSGITLFLAYLGQVSGVKRYTDLARSAWDTARELIRANPEAIDSPGAFTGYGGPIYTATHLAALWQDAALRQDALHLVTRLPSCIEQDRTFDIIGGAAGCLASLLGFYRGCAADEALAAAMACGDHLLAHAEHHERGMAWPSPPGGAYPLTGFSHGAAGIAWALAQLAAVSGESKFLHAAKAALRYERSWFSNAHGNWPDLRPPAAGGGDWSYMTAWCHGATGIGLGRLGMRPYVQDGMLDDEIRVAVRTTLRQGFGSNHCLCHGDLGNLDLLLKASDALHDRELRQDADRLAARLLVRMKQNGWQCGASIHSEVLGLMVGLAGIGYGLLRAAAPQETPSVLLLEPPIW